MKAAIKICKNNADSDQSDPDLYCLLRNLLKEMSGIIMYFKCLCKYEPRCEKLCLWGFNQVRHNLAVQPLRLENLDLGSRVIVLSI